MLVTFSAGKKDETFMLQNPFRPSFEFFSASAESGLSLSLHQITNFPSLDPVAKYLESWDQAQQFNCLLWIPLVVELWAIKTKVFSCSGKVNELIKEKFPRA